MKPPIPYPLLLILLAALLALLAFLSMIIGPAAAGTFELLNMMNTGQADTAWMIMREVRLPRTLLAMLIGMTLGLAGATLQGFLRNPLADPGVVGVSPAASLGAVIALYTGLSWLFPLALPLMGIGGALLCVLLLQGLAGRGGVLTLILAGVAVSSLCAAFMSLALNLSPNPYAAAEIMFWLMGSVTDRSMDHVLLAAPFMVAGLGHAGRVRPLARCAEPRRGSGCRPWRQPHPDAHAGDRAARRSASARARLCPAASASSGLSFRICCARWSATRPASCCSPARLAAGRCCWRRTSWCACHDQGANSSSASSRR